MLPGMNVDWMKPCMNALLESMSKSLALRTDRPMPAAVG